MNYKHGLFSVYGIELEYMIVDKQSLEILPILDKLFYELLGEYGDEVERGQIAWNNELVLHVLEMKTNGPTDSLNGLDKIFHQSIQEANALLAKHNALLLPTGAHPWMDPKTSMHLWPHGDREIYESYHRIFNCEGHGWANLQSTHINLPFKDDQEFVLLHNAIRVLLPIIPALTASTPVLENKLTGSCDTRLMFYGQNQRKIPIISGEIIPEHITSINEYHDAILLPMYKDIDPFDPHKILQEEWLNSRGAIARFERGAIEIRIVDIQECPLADVACIFAIVALLKKLIEHGELYDIDTGELKQIFLSMIKTGFDTIIEDKNYLSIFGFSKPMSAKEFWMHLLESIQSDVPATYFNVLQQIVKHGNLSERITHKIEKGNSIVSVYHELGDCLAENKLFL